LQGCVRREHFLRLQLGLGGGQVKQEITTIILIAAFGLKRSLVGVLGVFRLAQALGRFVAFSPV
jgi:hypothetical protein